MRGLKGKVGIVAGGGRGIGAATARRLAQEGAHVIIGDLMGDWANEVAESIRSAGGSATGVTLDGTNADSQAAIVACAVETYGGLDFYHSNLAGGTGGDIDILDCPADVLDNSFAINTKSHFLASQAALPKLIERGGGAMIYTSSGAASAGAAWQVERSDLLPAAEIGVFAFATGLAVSAEGQHIHFALHTGVHVLVRAAPWVVGQLVDVGLPVQRRGASRGLDH